MFWLVMTPILHVGGIPTQALFERPVELGELADQSAMISWRDNEQDMTGLFDFYYQPTNIRPGVQSTHPDFAGTLLAEGVPIMEATNMLVWDTSALASAPGSFFVYEITRDPPLNPVFSVAPAPITVQHAGDPRWPAVVVDEPDGIGDTQAEHFAIKWRATGEGTLSAAIRYAMTAEDALSDLAADIPMAEDAGIYYGCYLWNVSLLPQGTYYVQLEVSDEGGHVHRAFSRNVLVVYRNPDLPDAAVAPSCEGSGAPPDGGSTRDGAGGGGNDDDEGGGCPCRMGHRGRWPRASLLGVVALVALSRRRRPLRRRG